ncbi:hypothetical protein [Kurthia sp. Dielmo]|uniref:hypothetical protein n=1 Tax=Kurthia sp. Dielmo TaxID=1033738 RepID=UPI00111F1BB4|nr:hypothetical protein [Kurthia sp. Dielmo]
MSDLIKSKKNDPLKNNVNVAPTKKFDPSSLNNSRKNAEQASVVTPAVEEVVAPVAKATTTKKTTKSEPAKSSAPKGAIDYTSLRVARETRHRVMALQKIDSAASTVDQQINNMIDERLKKLPADKRAIFDMLVEIETQNHK